MEWFRALDTAIALSALLSLSLLTSEENFPIQVGEFISVRLTPDNLVLLGLFAFSWPILCTSAGLYTSDRSETARSEAARVVLACSPGTLLTLVFPLTSSTGAFNVTATIYFWPVVIVGMLGIRHLGRLLLDPAHNTQDVLIVGSGPRAYQLYRELFTPTETNLELVGFVDSNDSIAFREIEEQRLGSLDQLESILMNHVVDEVLIALPIRSHYAEVQKALDVCERVGIEAKHLGDVFESSVATPHFERFNRRLLITLRVARRDFRLFIKRMIDITGATLGIVALIPIMIAIAIAIKLTSSGPVLFAQERYGYNKRRFRMLKFRTMVANAETFQVQLEQTRTLAGPLFKLAKDPRITPFGRFLRRTSLDELPQLINVIRGEMSLVGPRPLPRSDVARFDAAIQMRRFSVPPGLTGLWQVSGRSNLAGSDWIRLDLQYIDQWSLGLDLKILAKTVPAVLRGTGAM